MDVEISSKSISSPLVASCVYLYKERFYSRLEVSGIPVQCIIHTESDICQVDLHYTTLYLHMIILCHSSAQTHSLFSSVEYVEFS